MVSVGPVRVPVQPVDLFSHRGFQQRAPASLASSSNECCSAGPRRCTQETSIGFVPLRRIDGELRVLVIKQKKGPIWSFPKGHPDDGETQWQTATRELFEETGLIPGDVLLPHTFTTAYHVVKRGERYIKTVVYYVALVPEGDVVLQPEEILDHRWARFDEALATVSHPEEKLLFEEVAQELRTRGIA
eukprot:tig00020943_g16266.t1